MSWQRARFLPADGPVPAGTLLWVRGKPVVRDWLSRALDALVPQAGGVGGDGEAELVYETHYLPPHPLAQALDVRADAVELLARGPEDFAEEVEREPWPER